jgi:catechol 2,3-dioxygenase-like lactoylglutathione lyase family enzyme
MLSRLTHLGLEVKYLDRARAFYGNRLRLPVARDTDTAVEFAVGETTLILRRPRSVPRGGLHTHFAFSTGEAAYGSWRDRLSDLDPDEHTFGSHSSLYVDDPDDHCVEIGGFEDRGTGLTGIFEVVLEVERLEAAEATYRALGFEPVDRGETRRRVRLRGPMDLELWEPQLGLADARGGVHVDLGFAVEDPAAAADAVSEWTDRRERVEDGVRVRDDDGHYLTFAEAADR